MSPRGEGPGSGPFTLTKMTAPFGPCWTSLSLFSSVPRVTFLLACGSTFASFACLAHPLCIEKTCLIPMVRTAESSEDAVGTWPKNSERHGYLKNFPRGLSNSRYEPELGGGHAPHCPSWCCCVREAFTLESAGFL